MRTTTIIDDALSLTMGTTGILLGLTETVNIDYQIDYLDDARREEYISKINEVISRLEKFAIEFNNQTFSNFVKRTINFLKADLEKQLYFEELSDDLRNKLSSELSFRTEKLREENKNFELLFFQKSYKK